MKYIRTFEESKEQIYTIVTDAQDGLAVNIKSSTNPDNVYGEFRYVSTTNIENYEIVEYDLKKAKIILKKLKIRIPQFNFRIIPIDEIYLMITTNKYNL